MKQLCKHLCKRWENKQVHKPQINKGFPLWVPFLIGYSSIGTTAEPISLEPICQPSEQVNDDPNKSLTINATSATLLENDQASFAGNVVICSSQIAVQSDSAKFSLSEKSVQASGQIRYHNAVVEVTSSGFDANLLEERVQLQQANYALTQNAGRGEASLFEVSDKNDLLLKDATFTTCPADDEGWLLSASEIKFSADEGWGEASQAVIRVNNTPIIYIPYLTFPLDGRRRSGFLYPNFSSSQKQGLEFKSPYYWNIAPNSDATLTPRIMSKRGVQLQSEFRYLTEEDQGLLAFEYLPNDQERSDLGTRHLLHWQHNSEYQQNLRFFIDFTQISDDSYLNDLGSRYQDSTDTQLNQQFELSYFSYNIESAIRVQNFAVLGQHPSSYQTLPQFDFNNRDPYNLGPLAFNYFAEVSHFVNSEATINSADRVHFEPSLSLDYNSPAWSVNSDLSLLYTYYDQRYNDQAASLRSLPLVQEQEQEITRTLPKFRVHSMINFERPVNWFGKNGLQTFEPQLQYLYVPYKDQTAIGLFDSTRLQDDYNGLFRDNRFSGLDRISDANQLTIGATSRFINPNNAESMRLSFGQIFYFHHQRNAFTANDSRLDSSKSALAGELFVHWSEKWYFNASIQYDTGAEHISKSNLTIDYRADKYKLAQLNHRRTRTVSDVEIEQLGLITSFPIAEKWQFVGGYHRDITKGRSIDSYAGVQYESCCWAIRLIGHRNINTILEPGTATSVFQQDNFDSGITLQLVIKGINGTDGLDIADMLQQGIFGYRRPYFLKN